MSKSRRIATVAALPVALGLMFAGPAIASASTTSHQAATTVSTASHGNDGIHLGLGGSLDSGDRHRGHDNESNLNLGLGAVLNLGGYHHGHDYDHHYRSHLGLVLGIGLGLGSGWDCDS